MKNSWLSASSLERANHIIAAINTLSIHAKLILAGLDDPADEAEVQEARDYLRDIVEQLRSVVQNAEQRKDGIVLGVDPRLGDLARQFLDEKRTRAHQSGLFSTSFDELHQLIDSVNSDDLKQLIMHLRDLRSLVEQHAHSDINHIFGDL